MTIEISLADIARNLGLNPKSARARLRKMGVNRSHGIQAIVNALISWRIAQA